MASRYVEVTYLDGPPMLTSIDERTPNKVNGYGDIADIRQRGYVVIPLIPLTPEVRDALSIVLGNCANDLEYEAFEGEYETEMQAAVDRLRGLLAETEATHE